MLQTARWTLRQPRYRALAAGMVIVAALCVLAGTWQIARFNESVRDNNALDRNAHAASTALTTALVPLVGQAPAPGRDAIRYRTVTTSGVYLAGDQQLVGDVSLDGVDGFYVLTPLRDATGVLLVVRGFVASDRDSPPATIEAPPAGTVPISGRLQTASTGDDSFGLYGPNQLESINATEQAARLHAPVYQAYLTLNSGQPGMSGLSVLPDPDLSNPAGGAYEAQHFAYILQWYLFAVLALAAPFIIGRFEVRDARRQFLGIEAGDEQLGDDTDDLADTADTADAAALSDATQTRQLTGGSGASSGGVAIRSAGEIARRVEVTDQEWETAARLADRYGRSLGIRPTKPLRRPAPAAAGSDAASGRDRVVNSASGVHRSQDAYHAAYNDYLWEIAMADGAIPTIEVSPPPVSQPALGDAGEPGPRAEIAPGRPKPAPIIIEGSVADAGPADDQSSPDPADP